MTEHLLRALVGSPVPGECDSHSQNVEESIDKLKKLQMLKKIQYLHLKTLMIGCFPIKTVDICWKSTSRVCQLPNGMQVCMHACMCLCVCNNN